MGDGLEGVLTDALSSQIIRREIVPYFKNGDYDGGITAGVNAILGAIEGSYVADEDDVSSSQGGFEDIGEKIVALGIFGFVVGQSSTLENSYTFTTSMTTPRELRQSS